jgi:tripartite ATP-independent transporter DctP family solute receptor
MLTRRTTLFLAGAALAAGGTLRRAKAAAPAARTLRIGYLLSNASQMGAAAKAMADEVAHRTDGRIQLQQFADGALGGEVEMVKGVQLGSIDLAIVGAAPLVSVLPAFGIFAIPFLFNSAEQARAVLDGPIGEAYRAQMSTKDLVALAWGEYGMRHVTNSKRPIVSPDDLKGLKLRLPQNPIMLLGFRTLGADPKPLPLPQLHDALQAGLFDGQENPIATIRAAKLAEVQKFLTLSAHVYESLGIVMSPDVNDDLSPEDRTIIMEAAKIGAKASRTFASESETSGVEALKQAGMQVQASIDRAQFVAALAPADPEFEKMFGKDHISDIRHAATAA